MDHVASMLLAMLEGAFRGRGWQGPTLTGALRGVGVREALYRPAPKRRCIWEHTLHAAYWKHTILRAVSSTEPDRFPRSPSNWPKPPDTPTLASWRKDVALLVAIHAQLIEVALALDPKQLDSFPPTRSGSKPRRWTYAQYLAGAAAHDQYHCGQIQLIKRLIGATAERP